jgi:Ca-activated chloride channel homolog
MRNSRRVESLPEGRPPAASAWLTPSLAVTGLFVAAAVFSARVAAHDSQDTERSFTLKVRSELVLLDVSVRDPKDGFVTGLKQGDFQIFEEGRREPIVQFGSHDAPVTIGLVVDASASMRSKRAEVVGAGLAFAKESNPHDEFFVVNFNDHAVRGLPESVPFTDDLDRLRRALYFGPARGRTALYDAISEALKHIRLGSHEKRTLIVVSDGGDNASRISRDDLLQQIQRSLVTIYGVAIVDPDDVESNVSVLRKIVQASGGELFVVPELEQVAPVFHQIAQSVRNRYTIGYVPDPRLDRETVPLRHIRVLATENGRKLIVRTRTSYRLDALEGGASEQSAGVSSSHEVH